MQIETMIFTRKNLRLALLLSLSCLIARSGAAAEIRSESEPAELHVAVASNFSSTMKRLATAYQTETGFRVRLSSGSTGKLYAQILNGAPYDVFLSADADRPERLASEDLADASSLRTYAVGQLVLVSNAHSALVPDGEACDRVFLSERVRHFAIANPRTAPYGAAAEQTLQSLEAWGPLASKLVRGENISQTFQFVESGNAQAGLIAKSQLRNYTGGNIAQCHWDVPAERHQPIEQKMVVLARASGRPAVTAFQEFIDSELATSIIEEFGYKR